MAIRPVDHGIIASAGGAAKVVASGGTETTSGGYKYHTYTTTGLFTVTDPGDGIVEVCH